MVGSAVMQSATPMKSEKASRSISGASTGAMNHPSTTPASVGTMMLAAAT